LILLRVVREDSASLATFVSRIHDYGGLEKPKPDGHSEDPVFPELTITLLFLGYRKLEELNCAFRDYW